MSRLWLTVAELQPPNEGFILMMLWQLDKLHYNCSCSSGAEERGSHARKWPASCWGRWPGCWKWAMIEIESLEPLGSLERLHYSCSRGSSRHVTRCPDCCLPRLHCAPWWGQHLAQNTADMATGGRHNHSSSPIFISMFDVHNIQRSIDVGWVALLFMKKKQ